MGHIHGCVTGKVPQFPERGNRESGYIEYKQEFLLRRRPQGCRMEEKIFLPLLIVFANRCQPGLSGKEGPLHMDGLPESLALLLSSIKPGNRIIPAVTGQQPLHRFLPFSHGASFHTKM